MTCSARLTIANIELALIYYVSVVEYELLLVEVAIFCFRRGTMSAIVGEKSVEMGDPENLGLAVGISILSDIEQELQVLPASQDG